MARGKELKRRPPKQAEEETPMNENGEIVDNDPLGINDSEEPARESQPVEDQPTRMDVPEISREEKRALFEAYDNADASLAEGERQVEVLKQERSDRVKDILDKLGSGPFGWNGKKLQISRRNDRFHFKAETNVVEEI